jgi:23S rRNA pseudouridine1911/1915/1917 synthase
VQSNNEKELKSRLLYQSPDCVVVNKLIGEAVEGTGNKIVNLQYELAKILPDTELVEAVHRLDVPVTGCSLFALKNESLSFLNSAFAQTSPIEKIYWAVTEKPQFYRSEDLHSSKELVHWIQTNTKINKSFAYDKETPGTKKAKLDYTIKGEGKNYLFIEINLRSGRHHQIRAQFAAVGLHIKGDLKYGAKRSEKEGGIRLHARSLSFPNPSKETEKIKVTADPPQMDKLWEMFLPL